MKEVKYFIREINIMDGKRRVKEIGYFGNIDNEGNFKLRGLLGRYYSEDVPNASTKNKCQSSFIIGRDIA